MKTNIFYGNQHIGKFNCDGKKYTKWQIFKLRFVRFVQVLAIIAVCVSVLFIAYQIGGNTIPPVTKFVDREVVKEVPVPSPVLNRIAQCESGNKQFKDGQVIINSRNSNGTSDIGVYQINLAVWSKKATELGYNLAVEADNRAFAHWLYRNFGTEPWYSSKSCWNK